MSQFMGNGKYLSRLAVSRIDKQKRCVFITQHKTATLFNCNWTMRIIIYHTVKYDINSSFFNFFSQMIRCFLPVGMFRSPINFESKLISDTLSYFSNLVLRCEFSNKVKTLFSLLNQIVSNPILTFLQIQNRITQIYSNLIYFTTNRSEKGNWQYFSWRLDRK